MFIFFNELRASELSSPSSPSGALDGVCALAFHFCVLTDYVRSFLQTYILGKVYNIDTQFFIGIGVAVVIVIWMLIREKK